jgi:predicted RNase H-like nuclease (RuvC/YqgF family)
MTALLIAQSHTPPPGFDGWVANAFYIVGLIAGVVVLWQKLRPARPTATLISGQPVHVSPAVRYVEEQRYEREREELKLELTRQARNRKERYEAEEARESQRAAAIADLQAQTESQGKSIDLLRGEVASMQGRIDAVPARTIALLKDTKGLI